MILILRSFPPLAAGSVSKDARQNRPSIGRAHDSETTGTAAIDGTVTAG